MANSFSFTADILGFGNKGSEKYPKLWIRTRLDPVTILDMEGKPQTVTDNVVFLNVDIPLTGPKAEIAAQLKKNISNDLFIFAQDVIITNIKRGKKKEDGSWETYEERGLRAKADKISLYRKRPPQLNTGEVAGKVLKQEGAAVIIEDRYRNPKKNEWNSREVPVVIRSGVADNLPGSKIYASVELAGIGPNGDNKVYGIANHYYRL